MPQLGVKIVALDKLEDEAKCRETGKLHQEGKTYEVLDGDIILFKFNVFRGSGIEH